MKTQLILNFQEKPDLSFDSTYSEGRKKIIPEQFPIYLTTVPLSSKTHFGDDVVVFASGTFVHYFSGTYEQTNTPAMMAKDVNIGPFSSTRSYVINCKIPLTHKNTERNDCICIVHYCDLHKWKIRTGIRKRDI
uniref:alkaline phosphatase n=1 Tax=Glossina brevipalpis TaxID=37001 RepID=A0A1A9WYK2_9MUSC